MSETPQGAPEERTTWSLALISFYLGCAVVSIGAAVAASGWIVFRQPTMVGVGLVMVAGGAIACLRGLRTARRE